MMDALDANTLLAHSDFVARVARRLIDDESQVEDVVQDTFVAALDRSQRPPPDRPRAWLARVARNLSIDRLRRRKSRERRERAAARAEGVASTHELAERVARSQRVVAAVLELEESYRSVVLLRFYEELPPREIARRLDVPVDTVRTRLRRALALLRGKLDRTMLVPLAVAVTAKTSTAAVGGATVLTMKKTLVLLTVLVAAAVLATATTMRWMRADESSSERSIRNATLPGAVEPDGDDEAVPDHLAGVVTGVLLGELPAECEDAGGVTIVISTGGREIRRELARPGPFRIVYRREDGRPQLGMSGPRIVAETFSLPDRETDLGDVHIERGVSFGGRVWGPNGKPLEGAVVYFRGVGSMRPWAGLPQEQPSSITGEDGRYRIEIGGFVPTHLNKDGYLVGVELYVFWRGRWGGGFAARPSAFALKYDFTAGFEDPPRLQFPGRQGKRLVLRRLWGILSPTPPPVVSETVVDEKGFVTPYWPPWIDGAHASLDGIQMVFNRSEVASSDPYRVDTNPANTIRLQMNVKPPGARVAVTGDWSPDGLRVHENGFFEVELGATEVALYGTAPADGPIVWRFAGERKGRGVYFATQWRAEYDDGDGEKRLAFGRFQFAEQKDVPIAGGSLPSLDLAAEKGDGRTILVAGVEHCAGAVYLKDGTAPQTEDAFAQQVFRAENGLAVLAVTFEVTDFDTVELRFLTGDRLVTMMLTHADWREAASTQRTLRPEIPSARVRAAVLVRNADDKAAANVVVTCVVEKPIYRIARTTTDRSGRAVFSLPESDIRILVAIATDTGQGAVIDHWSPAGRVRTLRLRRPQKTRFRVQEPGGAPFQGGGMLVSPGWIGSYVYVSPGKDGWCETTPVVPELYTFTVSYWRIGVRGHLAVPLRDIKDGQTLIIKETKR